ncbi:MAG: hypothetical protein LUE87_05520 [Lachnospiraceae bacterium]|nr:hypothetical protein [Lachnospiraceae bacterium]MCD8131105.1 hypothetical protein [Lachnospiraceae bacterium]
MANSRLILKWTNKFSGEEGYVKTVSVKKGYFVNTYDITEAKAYRSQKVLDNDIAALTDMGEAENNVFTAVEAE